MLDYISSTTPTPVSKPLNGRDTIAGQKIVKGRLSPAARANYAAKWMGGGLVVERPTTKQASLLFGACEVNIRKAKRRLEQRAHDGASPLETAWIAATLAERDALISAYASEFLDVIDKLTR